MTPGAAFVDSTEGVAPFERGLGRRQGFLIWRSERHARLQRFFVPPADGSIQNLHVTADGGEAPKR
jgi:hypothetical protein